MLSKMRHHESARPSHRSQTDRCVATLDSNLPGLLFGGRIVSAIENASSRDCEALSSIPYGCRRRDARFESAWYTRGILGRMFACNSTLTRVDGGANRSRTQNHLHNPSLCFGN